MYSKSSLLRPPLVPGPLVDDAKMFGQEGDATGRELAQRKFNAVPRCSLTHCTIRYSAFFIYFFLLKTPLPIPGACNEMHLLMQIRVYRITCENDSNNVLIVIYCHWKLKLRDVVSSGPKPKVQINLKWQMTALPEPISKK